MSSLLLGVITLTLGWHLQYLSFDFEFENFFPKNDPDTQLYEKHKVEFGYDNDFLLIILGNKNGLFEHEFLREVSTFEKQLKQSAFIQQVSSPVSQKHFVNGPTGLLAFPLIHLSNASLLQADSTRIFSNPFYQSSFGKDKKFLSIYLNHIHFQDQEKSVLLIDEIRSLADKNKLQDIRIVGKLTAQNEFLGLIKSDFTKYLIGSILLSFFLLVLIFKNAKAALLPFLISTLSLIWLFGLIGFLGLKINLLSSLLPPIIFFVSMSDAVHLMNAIYKSESKLGVTKIKNGVKIVWVPTLLTSITTAIGFLSLLLISTSPVQMLGAFAAIGILIAFFITFTFGLLVSQFLPDTKKRNIMQLDPHLVDTLTKNRKAISVGLIVLIVLLIPGVTKLKVDAYLLDDLPDYSSIKSDFEFTDETFGGSKPFEVRIDAKKGKSIWDKEVMDEVYKIETYLTSKYPISRAQSPVSLIKYLNQANNGGLIQHYLYPDSESGYQRAYSLSKRIHPDILRKLVSKDASACRIVGFIPELGSHETIKRNNVMLKELNSQLDDRKLSWNITGTTYLIDKSHELLSKNLLQGLLIAIGIIGIILGIYFKSVKLLLISLIPNLIPLLIVAGVIGWLGVPLKMTTAIIFTIAFGIAVDDTIHMMSYYLKNNENTSEKAMKATFKHAGSAMLITSIIMIAGFSLFLFSEFGATFYLGLFVSLSLIFALIIDITLLPLLLLSFKKKDA